MTTDEIGSDVVSASQEAGGWVRAILQHDVVTRTTRVVRRTGSAFPSFEAAQDDAHAALEEWHCNPRSPTR
ncbi:hypothetical protein BURKHO8Y_40035 [Burkholderia sp. 8Y]|nr:hypothetical protein BURKHO8Y_40035 [Burkholderia sp. 8Y]